MAAPRLREARDPRPHLKPLPEFGELAFDTRGKLRALRARPHEAHLAPHHVHDLRKLVEMEAAQHLSHRRRARIAGRRPDGPALRLRFHRHAPELEHLEHAAAEAEPRLAVQHRAAVLEPDRQRDRNYQRQPQRQQHRQREGDQRQVERAPVALAPPHRRRPPPAGAPSSRAALPGAHQGRGSRPATTERGPQQATRGSVGACMVRRRGDSPGGFGPGLEPGPARPGPVRPGPARSGRTGRTASGAGKMSGGAAS